MLSCAQYVTQVRQQIQEADTETVHLQPGYFDFIVDVREPAETEQGVIPAALCIPRGTLESNLEKLLPEQADTDLATWLPQQKILLYCRSGGRSALAAASLQAMGLTQVYSLSGGILAWTNSGYPIHQIAK